MLLAVLLPVTLLERATPRRDLCSAPPRGQGERGKAGNRAGLRDAEHKGRVPPAVMLQKLEVLLLPVPWAG